MKRFFFFSWIFLLTASLHAERIDPATTSFEQREQKYRIDVYDFSGEYSQLENIDIDARRKKRVEMLLTGEYPLLEKVHYEGSFGSLIGKITGSFPKLSLLNFLCSSAAMQLDLNGKWKQSCEINIQGTTGNIALTLPKDIGVIIHTKTGPTGKVFNNDLQKQGWGWVNKTFVNELYGQSEIQLTINVEVTKAKIILN